jgi:ectoine hydroxylase-related dioxygenase (phytanoyl-CoA dioxygenase family)
MNRLKHVFAETPAEEIDEILARDGCVVVEGLLNEAVLGRIASELDTCFDYAPFGSGLFVGFQTKRLGSVLRKSGTACRMLAEPVVVRTMETLLGDWCERIQVNLTQAVSIHPGARAQILHRDDELFPCRSFQGEVMANAMWALTEFTAENGATRVVPGSHLWPREREPQPHEVISAEMVRGSVLLYRGSLIHGGGANQTGTPRTGVICGYNLGWLRQGENQYLAYPPHVARFLPAEVQRLLGYTVHRPNLGLYECNDPQLLLMPGWRNDMTARDFLTPEQHIQLRAVEG